MIEYLISRARTFEQWKNWGYVSLLVENVPQDISVTTHCYCSKKSTVVIDWGDNKIVKYTISTSSTVVSHTYDTLFSGEIRIYGNFLSSYGTHNNTSLYPYIKKVSGFSNTLKSITLGSNQRCKVEIVNISGFPNLSTLYVDRCDNLKEIIGLSGTTRAIKICAGSGKMTQDFDLTNITMPSSTSFISLKTTGHIKVPVWINRTWDYDKSHTNTQPNLFYLVSPGSYEFVWPDGSIITDKKVLYEKIAQVVIDEELYKYPQMNVVLPKFTLQETRDMYRVHKVFLCDSGMQSSWQNDHHDIGTIYGDQMWTCSYKTAIASHHSEVEDAPHTGTYKVIYDGNPNFYITQHLYGFGNRDNKQRIVCENGIVTGLNGAEVISSNTTDGTTEVTFRLTVKHGKYAGYVTELYLYEDSCSDNTNHIQSFTRI